MKFLNLFTLFVAVLGFHTHTFASDLAAPEVFECYNRSQFQWEDRLKIDTDNGLAVYSAGEATEHWFCGTSADESRFQCRDAEVLKLDVNLDTEQAVVYHGDNSKYVVNEMLFDCFGLNQLLND